MSSFKPGSNSHTLAQRLANPYSCNSAGSQNKGRPSLSSGGSSSSYYGNDSKSSDNFSSLSVGTSTADFWNGGIFCSNSGTPKS